MSSPLFTSATSVLHVNPRSWLYIEPSTKKCPNETAMPAGFGSLPFDVLLTICQQVDALSNRGAYKSTTSSTGKLVGRHVVANADTVPDSLLALSAVNRCTRDVSEPLIFGTVTFGSKWEGHGELRWAIAKVRMRGMIQKQSLRHTVKWVDYLLTYTFSNVSIHSLFLLGPWYGIAPPRHLGTVSTSPALSSGPSSQN